MSRQNWGIYLLIFILSMTFCFNNADRDNPLDPRSKNYQYYGTLQGYVYTFYAPYQPISSAMICLIPGNQTTITNQSGAFSMENILAGNYLIIASYSDYATDTIQVEIRANQTTSIQFNLDGLPQLDSLTLTTGFIHESYPFEPTRLIDCIAKTFDPDGLADLASVSVVIPGIEFKDTLGVSQVVGTYQLRIKESDLPINHLEELLGLPFFIELSDKAGEICRYGPHYLVRIVDEEPKIISPRGSVLVDNQPILKWQSLQLTYPFSFKIEIYAISEDQVLYPAIYTFTGISSNKSEFQINSPLPVGLFLWTISIVDAWGNWSRSNPATFQVGG